jgi:flagellar biosynthetic protein FliR
MFTLNSADLDMLLALFFFPFVRVLAWLSFDPLLGNRSIPNSVRVGLALVLAVAMAPLLPQPQAMALMSGDGIVILLQQIAIGVALGFSLRIVVAALEMSGQFMGLQMGLSFATLFDPVNGAQTPVMGQFLVMTAVLMLFAMNGHHLILTTLAQSFVEVPIGAQLSSQGFLMLVQWAGVIFSTGLHIALPVTAALLATNLAIGMMTRAAPQLNIFAVGFPLTLGAGFLVFYLTMAYLPGLTEQLWMRATDMGAAIMAALAGR